MALVRAQVVINRDTGIPADVSVNTWHFLVPGADPAPTDLNDIHAALQAFYAGVDDLLSPVLNEAATIRYYDLDSPSPNPPVSVKPLTLVLGATATPFPEEVALCMSFKGDPFAGEIAARRRGRIFLGPLAGGGQVVVAGRVQVGTAQLTQVAAAAQALQTASLAATGWTWGIYSPTQAAAGGDPDSWFTPVDQGWIDNVYDTQRRRGPRASGRTTWT